MVFAALCVGILGFHVDPAHGQTTVRGSVVDASDESPLPGVNVVAIRLAPDSTVTGVATNSEGAFDLRLREGKYRFQLSFVGYVPQEREVDVSGESMTLARFELSPDVLLLDEAVVEATQERMVLRGDTSVYNADAFRVNPDASAEDLIRKMPGVVIQDGQVQAQGEQIRRVLVDGEEFFGNDPMAALRNLPSEIIQEVEVYDRQSDQARFTGFDDDNAERTINIVTRPGMQQGQFGRVFGGYGTDERYSGGAAINIFDGSRRISLIGLTNNINQQNFSSEDLMGVLGGGQGGGGQRGGMRGMSMQGGRGGGPGGMGANPRDYLVGERGGLNNTNSIGINYNDRWGEHVRINSSYFFNRTSNATDARLDREYVVGDVDNQFYNESSQAEGANANHRVNARIDATLSENTELTVTPRLSLQTSDAASNVLGISLDDVNAPISRFDNRATNDDLAYSAATNVLLRHRLGRQGRTISARVGLDFDGRQGESSQSVDYRNFIDDLLYDGTESFDREVDEDGTGRRLSANISYTEPIGERGVVQLSYAPSFSRNLDDQQGFRFDPLTGQYSEVDSLFTSYSERNSSTHRGGLNYRIRGERFNFSVGVDLQNELLNYDQGGPRPFEVSRSYLSVLPSANIRYSITEHSNLHLFYRSSTSTPGVRQLRDIVDDSNPLFVTSGNPDLRPSSSHRLNLRFRSTQPSSGSMFMGFASVSLSQDYVGNAVYMAGRDSVGVPGIQLEPGAQYSYPVNLDGHWSARSFVMAGMPIGFLKSNVNVSTGLSYTHAPSILNGVEQSTNSMSVDGRVFVGSNVSERVDFSLSYGLSYSQSTSTRPTARDNQSFRHRGSFQMNLLPFGNWLLESDVNLSHYTGLSAGVDPTTVMWNAAVGYKFLADNRAEVRLAVMDLLNQNTNVRRDVTDLYIEDSQTQALGRYFMLNLTYRVRHFGGR